MTSFPLRGLLAALAALSLLITTAACAGSGRSAPQSLTVGFVVDPSWAQVPVAQELGFFAQHGIDVHVINFSSGVEALQALAAGQVDVTTAADVPTAAELTRAPNIVVVGDGSRWNGSRIVARRSAGVTTIKDLAGRRVGTPLGTSAAYFAETTFADQGLQAEMVQVPPPTSVTAASQNNVDAISVFQPYQAQVIKALGNDAIEFPGAGYTQHSLYLATQDAVDHKAHTLRGFFAGLQQAGTSLAANDPAALRALATATQLDQSLLAAILPEFDYTLRLDPDLPQELSQLGKWAQQQGSIGKAIPLPDYATLIRPQFLTQTS